MADAPPAGVHRIPLWGVAVGVGGFLVIGYVLYKRYRSSSTTSTSATTGTSQTSAIDYGPATTVEPLYQDTFQQTTAYQDILNSIAALQSPTPMGSSTTYTVTGATNPSDQWAIGLAQAAYQIPQTDAADSAEFGTLIILMNPGLTEPYPVGTVVKVPAYTRNDTHVKAYTGPSGGSVIPTTTNYQQTPATLNSIVANTPGGSGTVSTSG